MANRNGKVAFDALLTELTWPTLSHISNRNSGEKKHKTWKTIKTQIWWYS